MRFLVPSNSNVPDDPDDYRLTLVEHLEELRNRLVRSLVSVAVGWTIGWFLVDPLYKYINVRILDAIKIGTHGKVVIIEKFDSATEPFFLLLQLSFWIGITLVFPYIVLQIWGFVQPGLKFTERQAMRTVAPWSVFLFILGATFAAIITPSAMTWFAQYALRFQGTIITQHAGTLAFFVLKMLLAFGVAFQLPLVVWILGALELLTAETLIKNWRQATMAIFVVAVVVTPSNDPATMLMMAIPLCMLFMASVYAVRFTQAKKKKSRLIEPIQEDGE